MTPSRMLTLGMVVLIVLVISRGMVQAQAPAFTVNSTADPGDGVCDATECTLREAINAANALLGQDTIAFNIPIGDPGFSATTSSFTIQPTTALPTITDPVVIDGYTQPGASANTNGPGLGLNTVLKIELDGTNVGGAIGLLITAGDSTVRGLVINRFGGSGVSIAGSESTGNLVQGTFIGTDATGTTTLGNSGEGVFVQNEASGNTIGGTSAAAANLISGNAGSGVAISSRASGNFVQGNLIGTQVDGISQLGNSGPGVFFAFCDCSNNIIGGTGSGAANTIAFNSGAGVDDFVFAAPFFDVPGTNNAILSNSIFSNSGLGIDLGRDGVTPNDAGDGDTGPNNLQNFPEIVSAQLGTNGILAVRYRVDSTTENSAYPLRIEFFKADADGEEGKTFLGSRSYPSSSAQSAEVAGLVNAAELGVGGGDVIVATATDANNNTSEFSQGVQVVAVDTPIPGLTQWGLLAMASLMAAFLLWRMGRSRSREAA